MLSSITRNKESCESLRLFVVHGHGLFETIYLPQLEVWEDLGRYI